jgi:hypothetical protein
MNKCYLLLLLAAAGFMACGQHGKKGNTTANSADSAQAFTTTPVAAPYFYIQLKGALGDQIVTMQLLKTGPDIYRGSYVYDRVGEPINIWGSPDSSKQQLTLYEDSRSDEETTFHGRLDSAGNFAGTWRGNGTSYQFTLHPDFSNAVHFQVYYAKDSAALLPNASKSPLGEASNSIIWPAPGTNAGTAALIKNAISGKAPVNDPQQLVKRSIDSFLVSYKGSITGMDSATVQQQAGSPTWNWTSEGDMKVVWNQYPLLSLEYFGYNFTGGAHGNGGATHQVLDLDKEKVLTLDDIFKGSYKEVLTRELELAFHRTYRTDQPIREMLLVDRIEPNNNFILTNKGILFSYTPYEIGPYAMGQVNLFVPFARLQEVLKTDYSK